MMEWGPLYLTFKLAFVVSILLLILGIPLAWWLSRTRLKVKPIVESLISLPLVLPPTVLGFYLLVLLSPQSGLGRWLDETVSLQLVFSFEGLVFASILYSLPFMVQPIQNGLEQIPKKISEAAKTLGKGELTILTKVLLPTIRKSILTGFVLSFAHTIGEFGVVLMIGGNIPDETRVASIAIFDYVESMNYAGANTYSMILLIFSFTVLFTVFALNGGLFKMKGK